jgi:hypothetical protein
VFATFGLPTSIAEHKHKLSHSVETEHQGSSTTVDTDTDIMMLQLTNVCRSSSVTEPFHLCFTRGGGQYNALVLKFFPPEILSRRLDGTRVGCLPAPRSCLDMSSGKDLVIMLMSMRSEQRRCISNISCTRGTKIGRAEVQSEITAIMPVCALYPDCSAWA